MDTNKFANEAARELALSYTEEIWDGITEDQANGTVPRTVSSWQELAAVTNANAYLRNANVVSDMTAVVIEMVSARLAEEAARWGAETVDIEYNADGGETVRESEPNLFINHSMCGEPGHFCPTGEHADKPYAQDWQTSHEKFRDIN